MFLDKEFFGKLHGNGASGCRFEVLGEPLDKERLLALLPCWRDLLLVKSKSFIRNSRFFSFGSLLLFKCVLENINTLTLDRFFGFREGALGGFVESDLGSKV